jgi:hypothetical protein
MAYSSHTASIGILRKQKSYAIVSLLVITFYIKNYFDGGGWVLQVPVWMFQSISSGVRLSRPTYSLPPVDFSQGTRFLSAISRPATELSCRS